LRLLHLFLADFGAELARLPLALPEAQPAGLDDRATLRWAARSDGHSGFVFVNNYQRIETLPAHEAVQFGLRLAGRTLVFPSAPVRIPSGFYAIWPFNLELGGIRLVSATAQPICRLLDGETPCHVFFAREGVPAEFVFDPATVLSCGDFARGFSDAPSRELAPPHFEGTGGRSSRDAVAEEAGNDHVTVSVHRGVETVTGPLAVAPESMRSLEIRAPEGSRARILLLGERVARRCWKATMWGRERLFLAGDSLLFDGETLRIHTGHPGEASFAVYPDPGRPLFAADAPLTAARDGIFTRYSISLPRRSVPVQAKRVQPAAPARPVKIGPAGVAQAPDEADFEAAEVWQVTVPAAALDGLAEAYLRVDY
ncbi:MAG: hypothetical protein AAB215_09120, partial [Planctomycetota bacterium]